MADWQHLDWYEEAEAYDLVFDAGTREEADFLEAMVRRHASLRRRAGARPSVLEPACGTGRLVVEMARRGWAVTGYDLSPAAIAYGRRRLAAEGLRATLGIGAMQSWRRARRFDLAFNLVSTFKYLLTEEDAVAHLRLVADMLRPGGLYVLGLHLTEYDDRRVHRERWVAERHGRRVTAVIQTSPPNRRRRTEAMRARLTVAGDGPERRFETRWTFRTYGPRQLRSLLAAEPRFECVAVHDFRYLIDEPAAFGGDRLDHVLVLRRRGGAAAGPPRGGRAAD